MKIDKLKKEFKEAYQKMHRSGSKDLYTAIVYFLSGVIVAIWIIMNLTK